MHHGKTRCSTYAAVLSRVSVGETVFIVCSDIFVVMSPTAVAVSPFKDSQLLSSVFFPPVPGPVAPDIWLWMDSDNLGRVLWKVSTT